ncbi:MAG: hypothetical protein IJY25_00555 [Bacilli bacterium]|nr:hypothetical protein [Bacilli bacterium]
MYEERKDKFSFKSFFLTLLLVLLFIFLLLWIFPTRWDVNKLQSAYDLERLSVLYDEIFANNVERMKDAAIGYFTNERMPQTVGESKKLTLQEMYDLHLVLKMKDKDGNACDANKSYVEMTKYTEEYRLKVNLSCGGYEDYIIVYLGCYDYCDGGICEKRVSTPNETTAKEEKPTTSTPVVDEPDTPDTPKDPTTPDTPSDTDKPDEPTVPDVPTIIKKYMYEYKLVVDDCTTCTNWSDWQKESVSSTDDTKVETKTVKELTGYTTTKIQTAIKTITTTKKIKEKYISSYTTELVVVDSYEVDTGKTTTKEVTEEVVVDTIEVFKEIGSDSKVPKDTETTKYKNVTSYKDDSCSYCEDETMYTYEIWTVEPVYDVVTKTVTVPVYITEYVYEEQKVPVYDYRVVEKKETKQEPVYTEVQIPNYENITYYRYQTCTTKKGYTDTEWSYNKLDTKLIGKGYKLTGNVKEV